MEYRELNEEYQPSLLGFGCMRFPLDAQGKIDENGCWIPQSHMV